MSDKCREMSGIMFPGASLTHYSHLAIHPILQFSLYMSFHTLGCQRFSKSSLESFSTEVMIKLRRFQCWAKELSFKKKCVLNYVISKVYPIDIICHVGWEIFLIT